MRWSRRSSGCGATIGNSPRSERRSGGSGPQRFCDGLRDQLAKKGTFVYLSRAVTPALAGQVMDLELPGIGVLPTTKRLYPAGTLASNITEGAVMISVRRPSKDDSATSRSRRLTMALSRWR